MSRTISQKYRPKNWKDLIGQNHIKVTLENEISAGKIAPAYLFCGPRGIGKTTIARLMAKSINCTDIQDKHEPCNKCESCLAQMENRALDVIEIDAASHTGVDNVRENIINNARVAPSSLKNKVFIIDEVHMLSISAFNALLKTLEEPPKNTVFILATTEVHKLPATIISRCQRFDFKRPGVEELADRLMQITANEKIKLDKSIAESMARFSEGHIRDAESLLSQAVSLAENGEITQELVDLVLPRSDANLFIEFFITLVDKNITGGFAFVNKLVEEGVDLTEFLKAYIDFLRKLMLYKIGQEADIMLHFDFDKETKKALVAKLKLISLKQVQKMIELFIEKFQEIKYSSIPQLPLELAVVELCSTDENSNNDNNTPNNPSINTEPEPEPQEKQTPTEAVKSEVKEEKIEVVTNKDCKLSVEKIQDNWKAIIKATRKENHALALTLKIGEVVGCVNGVLTIGFKYRFYQDRVMDAKNKPVLEKVFTEVLGDRICIDCVIGNYEVTQKASSVKLEEPNNEVVDMAVKAFGGKVV